MSGENRSEPRPSRLDTLIALQVERNDHLREIKVNLAQLVGLFVAIIFALLIIIGLLVQNGHG